MSEDRIGELDRRRRATGDPADELAWFREAVRCGELERRLTALQGRSGAANDRRPAWVLRGLRATAGDRENVIEPIGAATKAAGFHRLERLREMGRAEARRIAFKNCRHTMAYGDELLSPEEAESVCAELLDLIPSTARLFTNLAEGWTTSGAMSTDNLTGSTFDEGFVAWLEGFVIVVWFRDED